MREKIAGWLLANINQGCGFKDMTFGQAADQIHKEYMAWFREEIEKLKLLEPEQIEALIRKTFPLFELNEEGEEDRKKATLNLLQAQLNDAKRQLKKMMK